MAEMVSFGSKPWEARPMNFKMEPRNVRIQSRCKVNAFIKKKASKNYIVQQRITLAAKNGRPFDLRVMVQRHPNVQLASNWDAG